MELPSRIELPFFAYGLFRPGQLAFYRVKPFVNCAAKASVAGEMRIRDGLPILVPNGPGVIDGHLLFFKAQGAKDAYRAIVELEPDRLYRWHVAAINGAQVNTLAGKSPLKGSVPFANVRWDGRSDPLFNEGLAVVHDALESSAISELDLKAFFRLQMAYLLLWSAIERYASLRYTLGGTPVSKIMRLADEPVFVNSLRGISPDRRYVFRADSPRERYRLDAIDPAQSLSYYYQIRSNIVHRGKAVFGDYDRVRSAVTELLKIFEDVLTSVFEQASLEA